MATNSDNKTEVKENTSAKSVNISSKKDIDAMLESIEDAKFTEYYQKIVDSAKNGEVKAVYDNQSGKHIKFSQIAQKQGYYIKKLNMQDRFKLTAAQKDFIEKTPLQVFAAYAFRKMMS